MSEPSYILNLKNQIQAIVSEFQTKDSNTNKLSFEFISEGDDLATKIDLYDENHHYLDSIMPPFEPEVLRKFIIFWSKNCILKDFIDVQALETLSNTIGKEQTIKIFESFAQSTEEKLVMINKALLDRDFNILYETAHYVKTSAGIVGASYLFYFCELALLKCRKKEPWTTFFELRFEKITTMLPDGITYFRSQIANS